MSKFFYDLADDLRDYPEAAAFFIIGGNSTGKTYSALKYVYESGDPFCFVKRSGVDVSLICSGIRAGAAQKDYQADLSPFAPLNRELGFNVKAAGISLQNGLGGFWRYDDEGRPDGAPIGYIISLNHVQKLKGFDLSECKYLIFDEFIPIKGEAVKKNEGDNFLILYRLISRARELKGGDPLKMICLANAMNLNAPLLQTLRLTDPIAEMKEKGAAVSYLKEKATLIHLLDDNPEFIEKEKQSAIYKVAAGTRWMQTALNNEFAYDDFSQIRKLSIKGLRPRYEILYNMVDRFVIYKGRGIVYCSSAGSGGEIVNTDTDAGRLKFARIFFDLKPYLREGKLFAEKFSQYAFIRDFKA